MLIKWNPPTRPSSARRFRGDDRCPDKKWALLIFSLTRLTAYGEKTIEGANQRLSALNTDLSRQRRSWEVLSLQQRFIEVSSTVEAIESYE